VSVKPLFIGRFGRGVFEVHSSEGVFAAKVNDSPPDKEVAAKELDVFAYLAARAYRHFPALLPTRSGERMVHTGHRSVVLLEYVPGRFAPEPPPQPATWAALAAAMARLNRFDDYPHQGAQAFIDQVPEELRDRVRGHEIEDEFVRLLDRVVALRESPRRGLVHTEINTANSGLRQDSTVVLLDWDGVGTGPTALDYGYPVITQFIDQRQPTFHREAAEAFYGAYRDAGGVVDVHEAFLAGLFQAMFLMWFADTGDRWDRIRWAVAHQD
jgi:Ser/Thr protein kinase RdoA (MazF antagonist)